MVLVSTIVLIVKSEKHGTVYQNVLTHAQLVPTEMIMQYVKIVAHNVKHAHGLEPKNVLLVLLDIINNQQ